MTASTVCRLRAVPPRRRLIAAAGCQTCSRRIVARRVITRTGLRGEDDVPRLDVRGHVGGAELAEHNAPAAATLQALQGRVRLSYAAGSSTPAVELGAGELTVIGHERHGVQALADSVLVFTTVTGLPDGA